MKKLAALTLKAKIIIAATSAAVVAAGTVGTVMLLNNKEEAYRVVKVFETQGQYNTVDRGTSGTLEAYSGMNLQNGDVVTTGVDSNMRISLDGDKYILIDHDSEVHLVAENTAKDSKTVIDLKKGEILNEITEPLSENSTYEVNTPKATMAVRGTSFYVQTEETDNGSYMTDLEVVHGKVAVWLYDENGNKKGDEVYVSEGYKVTIVIDPNESSENTPDVDGNAYFVYRTDDGGFIECKDIDPAPYKTDFSLMPDLVKQTALASDDSGLLKLDVEIEKILRGEEVSETTTTAPTETSETENSTETSEISETTPETTTVADETSAPESSVVTEMPSVTTDAPVPSETTVPQESAPTESETTVPSVTTAPPETVTMTETTTAATETTTETSSETTTSTITTAEPEPEVATVLFADRSGNIVEQKEVEVGESIGALPAVPTVEGHTGKWTVDGEEISAEYVVMGDVTALAVYTANKYTVTFETEASGVTMPEALTAEYGSEITLPALPTKTGYTGVWEINGETVTGNYTVTDDVTVTAVYTINTYTVTFESAEDVLLPEDMELEYNTLLLGELPDVPAKFGYTGEWQIGGKAVATDYRVTGNVTVTAVYMINTYTVTFATDEQGVTMPADIELEFNTLLKDELPAVPTKTGYTGEWQIGGKAVEADYRVTGNVTVTAVYTINTYTVSFVTDEQGVTMPADIELEFNTLLKDELPAVPTKTGYTGEWQIGGKAVADDYKVTGNVTVTAVYTINTYTVTFATDEQGVTMPADIELEYNTVLKDELPAVPTKTGYTGEWQIDGKAVEADYRVTDNITVTAVYTINTYTVTFECDDETLTMPEKQTADYGTQLSEVLGKVQMPDKEGYTGKWTIGGEDIPDGSVVTDDVTITIVYTINTYTVTYVCKGADEQTPPADTADYNTKITLPEVPAKTGYTGEWQLDDGTVVTGTYTVTEDVTITAAYTINKYTVTFESEEDVKLPENLELEYNTVLSDELPEVPDLPGYTGEWQIGGQAVEADYRVTGNVTVTAVYTINKYEVTFTTDEPDITTLPTTEILEHGWGLANYLPAMPEKEGYTGRWTIDGEEIPDGYEVTSDITVKFEYVINTYEITFECDYDDVTMPKTITAEYGTKLSEALADVEIPEKEYYTGKWTIGGADITANDIVEDNVTVTAVYTHIEVKVDIDYVSGYSDSDDNDPANFRLSNSTTDTLDYDMTAEELQSEIATWKESVGSYTAVKVVYDNTETSLSDLDNPLDINNLPEIESGMSLSDIKPYDYTYTDGSYHSILRIYLVPDWTVHKVTFHDVDGSVIQQLNVYNNQFIDIPDVPSSVPDATWVSLRSDDIYHELDLANGVYEDVDAYCGYEVIAHEYYDGGWSEYGFNIYKKIGDTITEEDLENLCFYEVIAGFIDKPVNDASEITGFYSAGQEVNGNIDLYIIKASFDYERADGTTGTLYLLNDSMIEDELKKLSTSPNNVWRFDNANGDIVSLDTLIQHKQYDENNASPHTSARFKIIETAS